MKTIGVLTSSRADFGIYLPLLKELRNDPFCKLELIIFGTHLSKDHGFTLNEITAFKFEPTHQINTYLPSNTPVELAKAISHTSLQFSKFWGEHKFDTVVTLGDRYEMFAAITAASPFNLNIAHIHAGETTLGAIDNAYRHAISLFSKHLFVSTNEYAVRAKEIVESNVEVYNVGALSIDNLKTINYLSITDFQTKFDIDLSKPTILSTFHPETVDYSENQNHIAELLSAFEILMVDFQIVITMPNTDTMGQMVRDSIVKFHKQYPQIVVVESFGMLGYLSCMKHSAFLLGNTSSGFVEATYFPKYVINLGNRQKGRIETENIISVPIKKDRILATAKKIQSLPSLTHLNIYGEGDTAKKITRILKKL